MASEFSDIDIDLLRTAPLKNEEIVSLLVSFCSLDSAIPYREHIQVLTDRYDMTLEMRPLPLELLSIPSVFNQRMLANYYEALQRESYDSLIVGIIKWFQTDPSAGVYALILQNIFQPTLDPDYVRGLLDMVRTYGTARSGNLALDRYFESTLRSIADYAPVPDYIKTFDLTISGLDRLTLRNVDETLPSGYIADYLMTQVDNYQVFQGIQYMTNNASTINITGDTDYVRESIRDFLVRQLDEMDANERSNFLNLFRVDPIEVEAIQQNQDVFRVYGPVNQYADTDFSTLETPEGEPDIHKVFGGARMFTDMQLEGEDEWDMPIDDWFRGFCQDCNKRIKKYFYAVREPRILGGWLGCYCNWDCVRTKIKRELEDNEELRDMLKIRLALIDEVDTTVRRIGIADRD